jgi:hypothetical protein
MKYIKYLFLFVVIASVSACFPDNNKEFDGPTVLEFAPISRTVKANAVAGSADALIQLVGPQLGSNLTLAFNIDAASTAVRGTHYNLPASGTVDLAANTSSVKIPVTLIPGSVTAATGVRLILNLDQAAGGIQPNPNFRKYTLTILP